MSYRPTQAVINVENFKHNVDNLKKNLGSLFFCPMIKANAYGHGDQMMAKILSQMGVPYRGVGLIEEALHIRSVDSNQKIVYFGVIDELCLKEIIFHQIIPVISGPGELKLLGQYCHGHNLLYPIHLKIDTGMHRLGFLQSELSNLIEQLKSYPQLQVEAVMTHFAIGEDIQDDQGLTQKQMTEFRQSLLQLGLKFKYVHALNSAALIGLANSGDTKLLSQFQNIGARPGLACYGYSPVPNNNVISLRPVMSVYSKIVHIKPIEKGQGVSYGHTWVAQKKSWIGIIPMGYADGYPRDLSNKAYVLVFGEKCPVVGNVCMDYFMVDLTALIPKYSFEQLHFCLVTIMGYDQSGSLIGADQLAGWGSTITWEILTRLSERVPRTYLESP